MDLQAQIRPADWYNIPEPVKAAFEGMLSFQQSLANSVLFNAEIAHKKVLMVQQKCRDLDARVTKGFDTVENKLDVATKKINNDLR